ncbi:HEPN domain-containing protein [Vulcanisaeta thermophila]|uniref:HEPN domain-containing protein n=1 Tax=Vulcanisaeta thermophila TaxID=867917 RepID=UPI000A044C96|nr:HEPN domain-containing protein [Vulcanisaeta thermophila]
MQPVDCDEYARWIKQAEYTLKSIEADLGIGAYSWACFKAQQVAEFSLESILRALGRPAFGHNLVAFLNELVSICPGLTSELRFCVGYLDKMYVTPRYPDALTEGVPYERYTREEALKAYECAESIMNWVKGCSPCR